MVGNESANGHEFIDNAGMGYGYVQWCTLRSDKKQKNLQ